MDDNTLVRIFGEKIAAQMKLGKSYAQAYSNVLGQAIAEKFVEGLVEAVQEDN